MFVEVFFVEVSVALCAPGVIGVCGFIDIIVASLWYCCWFYGVAVGVGAPDIFVVLLVVFTGETFQIFLSSNPLGHQLKGNYNNSVGWRNVG